MAKSIAAFVLLAASACATTGGHVKPAQPLGIHDAQSLASHVAGPVDDRAISGTAAVRVAAPEKRSANLAFLLASPDRLRIDAMTVFGIPVASLAAGRGTLTVFEHGQNRYIAGPVTAPGARQFLLVPLTPPEFISLVTGRPLLAEYEPVEDGFYEGSQAYAATFAGSGGKRLTVSVSKATGRVREMIYQFPSHTLKLKFVSWRKDAGRWVPEKVLIDGGSALQAEVELGNWEFGEEIRDDDFWIAPPAGATYYRFEG